MAGAFLIRYEGCDIHPFEFVAAVKISEFDKESKAGDLAYSQGAYTATMTNPKTKKVVTETGKFVTVYKKQPVGAWKAVADIWNADAPAAPAKRRASAAPAAHKHHKSTARKR